MKNKKMIILLSFIIVLLITSIVTSSIAIYRVNNWVDGAGYHLKPKK